MAVVCESGATFSKLLRKRFLSYRWLRKDCNSQNFL